MKPLKYFQMEYHFRDCTKSPGTISRQAF